MGILYLQYKINGLLDSYLLKSPATKNAPIDRTKPFTQSFSSPSVLKSNIISKILALCPFTKIWECVKVIGFIISWSVKIKFSNWQGSFDEHVFDFKQKTERAKWRIRKVINNELKSRKRNTSKIHIK